MTEPAITSTANPRVKGWLRLRERRERDRTGLSLVDGVREVSRALDAGAAVEEAIVGPSAERTTAGRVALARLAASGVPLLLVSSAIEERLAFGDRSEGVQLVVRVPAMTLEAITLPAEALVLVVAGVEKPGNLGAVLRSADGAGADAVIAADPATDIYNPNVIRASLGTIFAMQLAAGSGPDVLAWCRDRGLRIAAARVDGSVAHTAADLRGALAIVLGSEAEGLGTTWLGPDIIAVRLPMLGAADSLNVSVAAAVLLYEARRQRDESSAHRS